MVDIDLLLKEAQLELRLGGVDYVVKDIPLQDFLSTLSDDGKNDPESLRKQLASLLGVEAIQVENVGAKGVILALSEIRKWLTNTVEAEKSSDENPK